MLYKNLSLFIALLTAAQIVAAQSGLYIAPSSNIFIGAGTIFSTDSLVLIPSANFTVAGENAATRNAVITHPSSNTYIKRVFHFLNTTDPFAGSITIYYQDAELNGLAENTLTLNVHDGTVWNSYATGVTRDAINNFVTTTDLNNLKLNELTLAAQLSPLPVQFTFFNSVCNNNNLVLNWQTAQEINSRNFEIQTSVNGSNWLVAGTVPAAGNSTVLRNYSFTAVNAIPNSLYRIAEYDMDGRFIISNTLRAKCNTTEVFIVHPNPVLSTATVTINLQTAAPLSLKLYDITGALVKVMQQTILRGTNQVLVDMRTLPPGTYNLTAQWNDNLRHVLLIKQ
jgi:hypothetical protein